MIPVAIKRAWVPEWLFRLSTHWLPLAQLLCKTPRCDCGELAEWFEVERSRFECPVCYRASLNLSAVSDVPECTKEKWCDMPGGHSGECRSGADQEIGL